MITAVHVASLCPEPFRSEGIPSLYLDPLGSLPIPKGVAGDVRPVRVPDWTVRLDVKFRTFLCFKGQYERRTRSKRGAYVDVTSVALEFTVDPDAIDADMSGSDRGES